MFKTEAKTVDEYLAMLPDDRRDALTKVRKVILENLPKGYEEVIRWGMPTYEIPLSVKPDTYNKQPLMYAAFASQKHHMGVYLMSVYGNPDLNKWFRNEYAKAGKKLDMGKSCVRFKKIEDLPLEIIGKTIAGMTPEELIQYYEDLRTNHKKQL